MDADDGIKVSYRLDGGAWVEVLSIAGASGTHKYSHMKSLIFLLAQEIVQPRYINGTFTNAWQH